MQAPLPGQLDLASRRVTRTHRATVPGAPEATLSRLADLPGTVRPERGLRFDGWPSTGLHDVATFRVSRVDRGDIAYEIHPRQDAAGVLLRATGPRWTADHEVDVRAIGDGASEVTWSVTVQSDGPVTDDLVAEAAVLSSATLEGLAD